MKLPFYVNIYYNDELVDIGEVGLIKSYITLFNNFGFHISGYESKLKKYKFEYVWWEHNSKKLTEMFDFWIGLKKEKFTNEDFCNLMAGYFKSRSLNYKFKIKEEKNYFEEIKL